MQKGVIQVPEGRKIFATLTVQENLEMGAFSQNDGKKIQENMQNVFQRFPRLSERRNQLGGTLSGGEQQMLAIARGLMATPQAAAARRALDGPLAAAGGADLHHHP